jgi:hypothetical protein
VTGDAAATNGWKFWEIQGPGGRHWAPIDELRSPRAFPPEVLAALARLGPQEMKALRKRFAFDTDND